MEEQKYYFKISPENIKGDLITVPYTGETDISVFIDPCCPSNSAITINTLTGDTGYYLPMDIVLSGGTSGTSILECLSINLLFTENTVDFGYYTPFDGAVLQKDVITNFLWSGSTGSPYNVVFYNTSETDVTKFLELCTFVLDWGDGSPLVTLTGGAPLTHSYPPATTTYEIVLTCYSPWGISTVTKPINLPYTNVTIPNENGTSYFTPTNCSWTGTPVSYDFIFTGDSNTNLLDHISSGYTTTPYLITGTTRSSINDLRVYGPKYNLFGGKFKLNVPVTGTSGSVGIVYGPDPTGLYTAYTINDILYWDLSGGTTIFFATSYGIQEDLYTLSAITKNEALMNVIDEPQIQSDLFVERGKLSGLEALQRLGEIDNLGDISKYGYGYFKVKKY
jgi:hypothetical protein